MTGRDRFRCSLAARDEPECDAYARVTVTDDTGDSARGCVRHAIGAIESVDGARVSWADTRGINEFERTALELTEENSRSRVPRPTAEIEAEALGQVES